MRIVRLINILGVTGLADCSAAPVGGGSDVQQSQAGARDRLAVIELFQSQVCSSCPRATEIISARKL